MKRFTQHLLAQSLWLVGFGLMLASSGLDGAFLCKLMPARWMWLGLVLNTTTDVASEVISYWFGRLNQDTSQKKRKMAMWLLLPQAALVFFAWLFGWRQIIPILREIEPQDWQWLAPIMAAFTPTALIAVGYTQALLAGRIEEKSATPARVMQTGAEVAQTGAEVAQTGAEVAHTTQRKSATITDWRRICAGLNGERAMMTAARVNELLTTHGFAPKPDSTARYWAKICVNGQVAKKNYSFSEQDF